MVEDGRLRHDFYHRLNVVTLRVPSLSERRQDIPALVEFYVKEFAERYQRPIKGFDSVSLQRLCDAPWKGNVRELRNTVERCVILSEGPVLNWEAADGEEGTVPGVDHLDNRADGGRWFLLRFLGGGCGLVLALGSLDDHQRGSHRNEFSFSADRLQNFAAHW